MEQHSVEAIVRALNAANVRYLIAGGLAVVAHGYVRFTADIDLILDLEPANVRHAMAAFKRLGYRPRAPVALDDFADPANRAEWVRDKGLTVFNPGSIGPRRFSLPIVFGTIDVTPTGVRLAHVNCETGGAWSPP